MNNRRILKWEIIGFILITLVGSALHFCFEWSGNYKPLALFCAVNESVWEHVKMGFWPALFYAASEFLAFGRLKKNFWIAKAGALYIIPIVIIVVFYLLEATIGKHTFWIDIILFVLSILLSQSFSYRLLTSPRDYSQYTGLSIILITIITIAFSLFTYFPPKLELFKDPPTGSYGIPDIKNSI